MRELALRGAEAFEGDEAAEREVVDFALSAIQAGVGLLVSVDVLVSVIARVPTAPDHLEKTRTILRREP